MPEKKKSPLLWIIIVAVVVLGILAWLLLQ
jgi:flagellar basal body-associated protein FliL